MSFVLEGGVFGAKMVQIFLLDFFFFFNRDLVQFATLCFALASSALGLIPQLFSHCTGRFILILAVVASSLTLCACVPFHGT